MILSEDILLLQLSYSCNRKNRFEIVSIILIISSDTKKRQPSYFFSFFLIVVPEYELVQIHSVKRRSRRSDDTVHRVSLSTPGRQRRERINLELSRVSHLVPQGRKVRAFYADVGGHGNSTDNVDYSQAEDVSEDTGFGNWI